MKKLTILLVVALSVFAIEGRAQGKGEVRAVEFEAAMGGVVAGSYNGFGSGSGSKMLLELRHNLKDSNMDLGLQFSFGGFDRETDYASLSTINKTSLTTFADYNFRHNSWFTPFVGLGLGLSFINYDYQVQNDSTRDSFSFSRSAALVPRVGVEFFNRLRVTAEYSAMERGDSYFAFNVGVVFGGGKKK